MSKTIELNGEPESLIAETLSELLRARGLDPAARGLAIALNGAVVPRARWAQTAIHAGDKVDIVRAFAGG
jgi:sulfur carrier protein